MWYTPSFWNSFALTLCVQRDLINLFSCVVFLNTYTSFKILPILCQVGQYVVDTSLRTAIQSSV